MSEKLTIEMSRYCVPFTPWKGTLEQSTVMLVSTAGVHHKDDSPFVTAGDTSIRMIPGEATGEDLRVADEHYDHACVDEDINCVFPIDRVRELGEEGRIKGLAEKHYSLGFSQALRELRDRTVPHLVKEIDLVRPDVVLLTGG